MKNKIHMLAISEVFFSKFMTHNHALEGFAKVVQI
jgi:hypothetical protein